MKPSIRCLIALCTLFQIGELCFTGPSNPSRSQIAQAKASKVKTLSKVEKPVAKPAAPEPAKPETETNIEAEAKISQREPTFADNLWTKKIGKRVQVSEFDGIGSPEPVYGSSELVCDFEEENCCWGNSGYDQLNWLVAQGSPDPGLFKDSFGTSDVPEGRYLVTGAQKASPADEAQFVSCTIECSEGDVIFKARSWGTRNTLIQVCTKAAFEEDAPLLDCVELPRSASPGPVQVPFPPLTLRDVVIVASNFVDGAGDVAIIDNIEVDYVPCDDLEPVPPPPPSSNNKNKEEELEYGTTDTDEEDFFAPRLPPRGNPTGDFEVAAANCEQVACTFENAEPCGYSNMEETFENGVTREFVLVSGDFNNKATGIRGAAEGRYYMATYLRGGDLAALHAPVQFEEDLIVRFYGWRATNGILLKGCCDDLSNCPYVSDSFVSVKDRSWRTLSFSCPVGTQRLIFQCDNTNTNQGACGVDNVELYYPSEDGRPQDARQTVCG